MSTRFQPRFDYILVRPVERKQSDVLHVVSHEKFTQGTIVAVGPGKPDKRGRIRPLDAKVGDFITYGDLQRGYDFYPLYVEDGVTYRILQEADVAFVADPDNEAHGFSDAEINALVSNARVLEIRA